MIKVMRQGSSGPFVMQWQVFLRGQGYTVNSSGVFDAATVTATKLFQARHKLVADGIVGNQSLGKAISLGFEIVEYSETQNGFPAKPAFLPMVGTAARQKAFGPLEFAPDPTPKNPERIRITNGWAADNIQAVELPQLRGVEGASATGRVYFHRKAARQLAALWQAWERKGLLKHVLTYSGDYVPRFVRGKADEQVLSNHAFGTAFDINYSWNKLGVEPATEGEEGCLYKLVPVAHDHGFYWGGHFNRRDGMHFEVAQVA